MSLLEDGIVVLIQNEIITLLVFALVFTIVFAVQRKIKFLAKDDEAMKKQKRVHAMIALVLGILSVTPHYIMPGSRYDIVDAVTKLLPQISLLIVAILAVLILLGIIGLKVGGGSDGNPIRWIAALIMIAFVLYFLFGSLGTFRLPYWLSSEMMAVIIVVIVFGFIVSFIMRPEKKPGKKKFKQHLEDFIKDVNKKD